ncbi:hypothetical protein CP533_4215 [Ophiocordyceps camponoti-saundersi (nom. inval.)]|nr:hypothetical protein CP533_4215 [Ophiocordyceps camponoti-saundersi (nom. inval.)]
MTSQRQELLESLVGQPVHIPDLRGLFSEWPAAVNPNLEDLRAFVSSSLKSKFAQNSAQYKTLDKMDIGLLTSAMWPDASFKRARVLSILVLWLFAWDDEMDTEIGRLADDFEAAEASRRESIDKISHCFHLGNFSEQPVQTNTFHDFLTTIGNAVNDDYGIDFRMLLLSEFKFTAECISTEQRRRLSSMLPTPEEYIATRMGTSGSNITSLMNWYAPRRVIYLPAAENICLERSYASETVLPLEVLTDPDMKVILDQVNLILWTTNDLYSLRKEIGEKAVDSLVPLLYNRGGNLEAAVSQVVHIMQEAIQRLDRAATKLATKFAGDETVAEGFSRYINTCRQNCTGSLYWSVRTARYSQPK